jgi:hypothetical protein
VKLIFGEREAAVAEARQLAEHARKVERCSKAMMTCEKIPRRTLVKMYGLAAVEECERRFREAK